MKAIYKGSQLLHSSGKPSYLILTDETRIDFELTNTPIDNFCTSGDVTTITVNGVSVVKDTIREVVFGSTYSAVTIIGNGFFLQCTALSIVDMSSFNNIVEIKTNFFRQCTGLTLVNIGSLDFTDVIISVSGYYFYQVSNSATRNIKADTLYLANAFKGKFTSTSNWTVIVE